MKRRTARGVTYLELMVVMAMLALLSLLALPRMRGPYEHGKLRAGARALVGMTRLARSTAVINQADVALEIDVEKGLYRLDMSKVRRHETKTVWKGKQGKDDPRSEAEEWTALPKGVAALAVFSWDDPAKGSDAARIRFYADGSASDSAIVLGNAENKLMCVAIDRSTGLASASAELPEELRNALPGSREGAFD
ncbi:MAG: hypothetical protein BWZ10_01304 [candidate division BRC1 bacterium ADurb.BinA364]|nr:MAG: hypothetical protein BWZ10_01304 [candidate division BRC1 bacterium ADurb.BinA364]